MQKSIKKGNRRLDFTKRGGEEFQREGIFVRRDKGEFDLKELMKKCQKI
jgi:hypothetical protein